MFFSSAWEKRCFWACRINSTIQLKTCLVSSYFCLLIPMELSECDRASSRSTGQFPSWKFATKARNLSPCTLPLTSTVIVVAFDENPTTVIFLFDQTIYFNAHESQLCMFWTLLYPNTLSRWHFPLTAICWSRWNWCRREWIWQGLV